MAVQHRGTNWTPEEDRRLLDLIKAGVFFREPEASREIRSGPCTAAEGEEMSDGDASLRG